MDQIQAMRIFTRVVEAGTFTRAADSLSLPKATVTKHVQALEERLRVKLLNRTTRRVTVTADGAAYYERTVRLLSDLDDIEASMTNARASPMGRLRVDVGTSVAQLLIIPHLADFQTRFPDIQLDLGVSDRTVDLIGDNVDCVIRGGELSDQSLVARHVGGGDDDKIDLPRFTTGGDQRLLGGRHRHLHHDGGLIVRALRHERLHDVGIKHPLAAHQIAALDAGGLLDELAARVLFGRQLPCIDGGGVLLVVEIHVLVEGRHQRFIADGKGRGIEA